MRLLPTTGNDDINTVYVRTTGRDEGGAGTLENPYATFAYALKKHLAVAFTQETIVFDITGITESFSGGSNGLQIPFCGFAGDMEFNLATSDDPFAFRYPITVKADFDDLLDPDYVAANFSSGAANANSTNTNTRWDFTFAASSLASYSPSRGDMVVTTTGKLFPIIGKSGDVLTVVAGSTGTTPARIVRQSARLNFSGADFTSAAKSGILFQGIYFDQPFSDTENCSFEGCYLSQFTWEPTAHRNCVFRSCTWDGSNNERVIVAHCDIDTCFFHEISLEVSADGSKQPGNNTASQYPNRIYNSFFRDTFGVKILYGAICDLSDIDLENMTGGLWAYPGAYMSISGVDSNLCKTNSLVLFENARGHARDLHGTTTGPYALELKANSSVELQGTNDATGGTNDLKVGSAAGQTWASVVKPLVDAAQLCLIHSGEFS